MPNGTMTNIALLQRYNSYTNCFQSFPTNENVEVLQRIQTKLNRVYDMYYCWLALPLASIAFVITLIFIISIFRAIRQHRVSRNSYVLILNRSIGDLLACTVAIFNGIYILLEDNVKFCEKPVYKHSKLCYQLLVMIMIIFGCLFVPDLKRYDSHTNCFENDSTNEKQRIQIELNRVYDVYYGWLAVPLASIALIITIIFIISIFRAIRQHRVSRKSYVLILNRSIGDLLACTVAIFNGIYIFLEDEVNRDIVQAVDSFFVASYWAAMVSYVSLSLLKLYAVARPFDYRRNVNMKRCIHLMIISWIIFAFIAVFSLSFMALVKIGFLREWSGCRTETCLRLMYRIRNFFTVSVYLFTIICFLLTVLFINRARRFVSSFNRQNKDGEKKVFRLRFPLWKLAVNVTTFAILHGFYAIWGAATLILIKDPCFWTRNSPMMITYLGYVRATILIRIIIDPIISFITDYQVRRIILSIFCISQKVSPLSSKKKKLDQTSKSEENSFEAAIQTEKQAMRQGTSKNEMGRNQF